VKAERQMVLLTSQKVCETAFWLSVTRVSDLAGEIS